MSWTTAVGVALAPAAFLGLRWLFLRHITGWVDRKLPEGKFKRVLFYKTNDF